jgi:ribonuclease P protein component
MTWTKQSRIRKSRDFKVVQKTGSKLKSRDFLFIFLSTTYTETRVGLIVSKKVGNAVVRNRVKRRLREACRHYVHQYSKSVDVVIVAFTSAKDLGQLAVNQQVEMSLNKIQSRIIQKASVR